MAFAIDAWWHGVQDRRLASEYMEQLLGDQIDRGDREGLDNLQTAFAAYAATQTSSPSWISDTFEELKSAGNLHLLQNSPLRAAIFELYRYFDGADYTYELMSTAYRDSVRARLSPDIQLAFRRCRLDPDQIFGQVADCGFDAKPEELRSARHSTIG